MYTMRRDFTEVKLLTIRQGYRDALDRLLRKGLIPFEKAAFYRQQIEVCSEMLAEYRRVKLERIKNATPSQAS